MFWKFSKSKVFLTGGEITKSKSLVGPLALQSLEDLHFDIAVLGVHGFSLKDGLSCPNIFEAQVNKKILSIAKRSIIIADSDKWNIVGLKSFASMRDIDLLISDKRLSKYVRKLLFDNGVPYVIAE